MEDIDVERIPEDKDIILEKKEKVLFVLGKKVPVNSDQKRTDSSDASIMNVKKDMFEERSFSEFKEESFVAGSNELVFFDWGEFFRHQISWIPYVVLFLAGFTTFQELYRAKHNLSLIEEQELNGIRKFKKSL